MGSDALYNEQALLWAVIRFVCAVTGMRRPPRPPYWRGAAWVQAQPAARKSMQAQPAASYDGGGFLWEVGTSYNERRFLWGVIRFVWAVTCVRAGQPAFMRTCRIRGVRGFYGQ